MQDCERELSHRLEGLSDDGYGVMRMLPLPFLVQPARRAPCKSTHMVKWHDDIKAFCQRCQYVA